MDHNARIRSEDNMQRIKIVRSYGRDELIDCLFRRRELCAGAVLPVRDRNSDTQRKEEQSHRSENEPPLHGSNVSRGFALEDAFAGARD